MSIKIGTTIYDISEIFKEEEKKVTNIPEDSIQTSNNSIIFTDSNIISSVESINIQDSKASKKKEYTVNILFVIFFAIEIAFTIFMLYNLYYIFNRPSKNIDLDSTKYNNTLNFKSMSSNIGTINGTALEMFHDVYISRNTRFVELSAIGSFYPNGLIQNNTFNIDNMYTDKLIFKDTNIIGRGDFKGSIDFNNVTIIPSKDFNVVEIIVGNFSFTSDGVKDLQNGTDITIESECNKTSSQLHLLDIDDQNSGEVIGQYNHKLAILKNEKVFLRASDIEDQLIFDFDSENYKEIKFTNFIAKNNEIGLILKTLNDKIQIYKSNSQLSNIPQNIVSASLFQNKSLIYCIDDCHEIKIMPNIDKPEKSYILLDNPNKKKFIAGRLYGGKILIATTDINNNHNHNVFVFNCQNPVDIDTFGKMAVITDFQENENKYNFWLFNNNQTKLITSIYADSVKASFIHSNSIIIAYSDHEKGSSYFQYDIFDDHLSSEIKIDEYYYDSFYISHELLSIFGNRKNFAFYLLEQFAN